MAENNNEYLNADEAASFTRYTLSALARFRCERRGPPYIRIGRVVRYRRTDLVHWMDANRVEPEKGARNRARGRKG